MSQREEEESGYCLVNQRPLHLLDIYLCGINLFLKSRVWILVDFARKRKEISYRATLRLLEYAVHTPVSE